MVWMIFSPKKIPEEEIAELEYNENLFFWVDTIQCNPLMVNVNDVNSLEPKDDMKYFYPDGAITSSWKIYDNIDNYIITGYAFDRTKDTKIPNICLVLLDETTGIYYGIYTEIQKREDVTKEYGNEKYNYDLSGFVGYFSKKMIQKDHKYKICLIYKSDENKNFIASELYIEE